MMCLRRSGGLLEVNNERQGKVKAVSPLALYSSDAGAVFDSIETAVINT